MKMNEKQQCYGLMKIWINLEHSKVHKNVLFHSNSYAKSL
jgi:hypothetical protein